MYELKNVDVWSVVKITFILSFVIGLIFGVFYFFIMLFVTQFAATIGGSGVESEFFRFGGIIGFFMIFFIAIFTAVFYTIISAIFAALYNLIAGWTGGFRINLAAERVDEVTPKNE
jgi:hypothetical protein